MMKKYSAFYFVLGASLVLLLGATVQTITTSNLKDLPVASSVWGTNQIVGLTNGTARLFSINALLNGSNVSGIVPKSTYSVNVLTNPVASSNLVGLITPAQLPAGLSSSNYVGTFVGNGAGVTNVTASNLVGGFTGNFTMVTNGTDTATMHITNGVVISISAP